MSTTTAPLFTPYSLGELPLPNRIVMPPMTRSRSSQPGDVPNDLMAAYYAQRASAGLIISEGTWISPLGKGYAWTPGICTEAQIAGWRKVTDAVHAAGGRIFAQLWHVGRLSHSSLLDGQPPVSSSALQATGVNVYVVEADGKPGFAQASTPRALSVEEIHDIVDQYRQAAPETTYTAAAKLLDQIGVAYIHIAEADWEDAPLMPIPFKQRLRDAYTGCLIYAGNYTAERANTAISEGWADLIGFGRTFIANPDLPERLRVGDPLNTPERETFFGGDAKGFTDYPTLAEATTA